MLRGEESGSLINDDERDLGSGNKEILLCYWLLAEQTGASFNRPPALVVRDSCHGVSFLRCRLQLDLHRLEIVNSGHQTGHPRIEHWIKQRTLRSTPFKDPANSSGISKAHLLGSSGLFVRGRDSSAGVISQEWKPEEQLTTMPPTKPIFEPDAFMEAWSDEAFVPTSDNGLSFKDCIIKAFNLPPNDDYVYRAQAVTNLDLTQRAINGKRAHGLHGWYHDEEGNSVCRTPDCISIHTSIHTFIPSFPSVLTNQCTLYFNSQLKALH